jgi:hypothetical protein
MITLRCKSMEVHFGPSEPDSLGYRRYSQETPRLVQNPRVVCDLFAAYIGSSFRLRNNCTEKCTEKK